MPHGGARPGAGRKRGYKEAHTLEKEAMRERLRQRVFREIDPMIEAQIAHAKGVKYLVTRDKKTGKFKPVPQGALKALNEKGEHIEIWEEKPSTAAFTDLMNRAIDKPVEQVVADVTIRDMVAERLKAARERLAKRGKRGNGSSHV